MIGVTFAAPAARDAAMDDLLKDFLVETTEHIDAASMELVRLEKDPSAPALIASLFRHIHTIKGSSGFLSLPRVGRLAHAAETLIGRLRDGAPAGPEHVSLILAAIDRLSAILVEIANREMEPEGDDSDLLKQFEDSTRRLQASAPPACAEIVGSPASTPTEPAGKAGAPAPAAPAALQAESLASGASRMGETVRVSVGVLDRLMGIVSELVLTRNQLLELSGAVGDESVKSSVQSLSSVTSDLQDAVMRVRMQPVERLFATLPRLVRDLSLELGKKIELTALGAETELDRQVIELIRAPLTHIIRNAADHGLEPAAERLAAGKPEAGHIRVTAAYDAGQITIEVKDDGRGFDLDCIREKALAKGLATEEALARLSEAEIYQFVLLPGFSTAAAVTKVSGRGVGMDVVRENIHSIGGTVSLNSRRGRGATVTLRIPLTLAIAPALILSSGGSRFAIPQMAVVEVVGVGEGFESAVQHIYDAPVLRLRGDALPIVHLAGALDPKAPQETPDEGFVVVLRVGGVRFGLLVDTIADVQEVVIEPLVGALARIGVFSGQTILGDGSVVLILDPAAIVERAGLENIADARIPSVPQAFVPESEKTRIVLMRAGAGPLKALPLSLVMRIEEVEAHRLVRQNGAIVMLHEDRLLSIVPAAPDLRLDAPIYPILILAGAGQAIGLLVEEIVDVSQECLHLQPAGANDRTIGSLNLHGRVVEMLDITYFIEKASPGGLARGVNRRPRILLVDDKPFFRDMLAPVLMAAGYDVTCAASGREALAFVEKGLKVHAAVTDIDMPDMDGYALARALLRAPGCDQLPIVALAPQATAQVCEATRVSGMRAVAGKFDRRALIATIDELLRGAVAASADIERRLIEEIAA
jgi:two-component system chemotaxis sensor kinase CheA